MNTVKVAQTFNEWRDFYNKHIPQGSGFIPFVLEKMAVLATTRDEWHFICLHAPEGSELRQTAIDKIAELDDTP